jgi:hypothetical protein
VVIVGPGGDWDVVEGALLSVSVLLVVVVGPCDLADLTVANVKLRASRREAGSTKSNSIQAFVSIENLTAAQAILALHAERQL